MKCLLIAPALFASALCLAVGAPASASLFKSTQAQETPPSQRGQQGQRGQQNQQGPNIPQVQRELCKSLVAQMSGSPAGKTTAIDDETLIVTFMGTQGLLAGAEASESYKPEDREDPQAGGQQPGKTGGKVLGVVMMSPEFVPASMRNRASGQGGQTGNQGARPGQSPDPDALHCFKVRMPMMGQAGQPSRTGMKPGGHKVELVDEMDRTVMTIDLLSMPGKDSTSRPTEASARRTAGDAGMEEPAWPLVYSSIALNICQEKNKQK